MPAQALAEEYFGKQSSISISHPLHSDVLNFTVRLPNGFNMLVNEDASEWINIDGTDLRFRRSSWHRCRKRLPIMFRDIRTLKLHG